MPGGLDVALGSQFIRKSEDASNAPGSEDRQVLLGLSQLLGSGLKLRFQAGYLACGARPEAMQFTRTTV